MKLGTILRSWRQASNRGLRDVSCEIGISYSTLMRIEHGSPMSDSNLAQVLTFLMSPGEPVAARERLPETERRKRHREASARYRATSKGILAARRWSQKRKVDLQ